MHNCPASRSRAIAPADRCSCGSPAIDDLSRAEAQRRQACRLSAGLCRAAGQGAALVGSRLERDDALRDAVLDRLEAGWSPEQVAGRLALDRGRPVSSHESIYRFIYAQLRRTNDGAWRLYLPRARAKRGWRGTRGGSPASFIKQRRPISERPRDAERRDRPGHWEADYMLFSSYGQSILVAHERATRATLILRTPNRQAEPTASAPRQPARSHAPKPANHIGLR